MLFRAAIAARVVCVLAFVTACGNPTGSTSADGGSTTEDGSAVDGNAPLTPDLADPKSSPCTGMLGFPGIPALLDSSFGNRFVVADLDGDGNQDVVAASQGFRILRGYGDGTFHPETSFAAPVDTDTFTLADMNGDARPDLVYGFYQSLDRNFRISLNNGSGGFGSSLLYDAGGQIEGFRAVDMNGDGKRDLITMAVGDNVAVRLQTASSFSSAQLYPIKGTFFSNDIEVSDLTGDGRPEVIVTNRLGGVLVFLNDGAGGLLPPIAYPLPGSPDAIAVGDFNEDGKPDVVVGTGDTGSGKAAASLMLNVGGGVLSPAQNFVAGDGAAAHSIAVADANGDGHIDVAISYINTGTAYILFGNGAGLLAAPLALEVGDAAVNIALADLDNDGRSDLLLQSLGVITPHLNTHSASLYELSSAVGFAGFDATAIASPIDINSDGQLDLVVVGTDFGAPRLATRRGIGGGTFGPQATLPGAVARGFVNAVADFDNDGHQDHVVVDTMGQVLLTRGDGKITPATPFTLSQEARAVAVADLDHDGVRDLVVSTDNPTNTIGRLELLRGHGDGSFASPVTVLSTDRLFGVVLADLDGDGHLDIVVDEQSPTATPYHRNVMRGHGDGKFDAPSPSLSNLAGNRLFTRDLNADGKPDLIAVTYRKVEVTLGTGTLTLGTPTEIDTKAYQAVGFADFNGDGALDIVTSDEHALGILTGKSDGTFAGPAFYKSPGDVGGVADVDGDGTIDIVVSAGNNASVLRGRCLQ